MILKSVYKKALLLVAAATLTFSCTDDPTGDSYYTFTGQMMSEYLQTNENFSMYAQIVERAGLMDLLAAYGSYTCFAPTNDAVNKYLSNKGLSSVDQLSDADCDTIAKTHLVDNMYTTSEMSDGVLSTPNMNRRYLEISHGTDANDNGVVYVNKTAYVIFALQDDSVENGVMQPVTEVLQSSNSTVPDIMEKNPKISLFCSALSATGLRDSLLRYKDESYDPSGYERYSYESDGNQETATVPDQRLYGYTVFVETDSILKNKYKIETLEQLYNKACELYDPIYPEDASADYHSFSNLTDRRNPLNRFIAYHILNRNCQGWNYLTPHDDITILTTAMNPEDWYETMLPYTMMNIQKLTVYKYVGAGTRGQRYINRRVDDNNRIEGAMIQQTVEAEYDQQGLNGLYFYIDDIIAFDEQTRDYTFNRRIRMDLSTIFPELMSNGIRQNGDYHYQDPAYDETAKYGRNYYFPEGYLDGVINNSNGYFIYRRPHDYYWSYEGDELNILGDYDLTFRIPPVPSSGTYQIRLGFCATVNRGIVQVYYGEDPENMKPQGIPIDMTVFLDNQKVLGTSWATSSEMTDEDMVEDQKTLKNKGLYRGAKGAYHYTSAGTGSRSSELFYDQPRTFRQVLCTVYLNAGQYYYLRFRDVSKASQKKEFMLDYLELVPKSVYGVSDEGTAEDYL